LAANLIDLKFRFQPGKNRQRSAKLSAVTELDVSETPELHTETPIVLTAS